MEGLAHGDFQATFRGGRFRLKTTTIEGFRALQRYCYTQHISFFTHNIGRGKPLKVVISGLPDTNEEELSDILTELKFAVDDVARLRTARGPTRSWLITLSRDSEREDPESRRAAEIYGVTTLLHVKVSVSAYKRPRGPPQCYRCQGFGHGSGNCGRPRKCVRCGGEHTKIACPKPKEEKGLCCNCGGEHNASYRGCKTFKEALRTGMSKPADHQRARPRNPSTKRPAERVEAAPTTPPDDDIEEDAPARKKRRRKPRNPANRQRQEKPEAERPSAPEPKATPRKRVDWPPKPVTKTAATAVEAAPAEEPATAQPARDIAAIIAEVVMQLTAVTRLLTEALPALTSGRR